MSDRPVRRVSRFASQQVWAITESKLDAIVEVLRMRAAGIVLSKEEIQARIGASTRAISGRSGAVGVLPLCGVISPKVNTMTEISGGTSLDVWMTAFREMRDDPGVTAIVLDVDSPGGSVFGVQEAADEIYKSRSVKPITAFVDYMCGSAALWLACSAGRIISTPSGEVGSLGVFCMHECWEKANEMIGMKPTYISAGQYKVEGNQDAPLSDDALAYIQSQVDAVYATFLKSVAKGRGVTVKVAEANFGQGRMLLASDALAAGLIDGIDTMDGVIRSAAKPGKMRAETETPAIEVTLELDGKAVAAAAVSTLPDAVDPKGRAALDAQQQAEHEADQEVALLAAILGRE